MSFDSFSHSLKIWESNSQSGKPLGSVQVPSLTPSYIPRNMKCDSQASLSVHTLASPCFDYELKAKFATSMTFIFWKGRCQRPNEVMNGCKELLMKF
jgi:hypothetical protein